MTFTEYMLDKQTTNLFCSTNKVNVESHVSHLIEQSVLETCCILYACKVFSEIDCYPIIDNISKNPYDLCFSIIR